MNNLFINIVTENRMPYEMQLNFFNEQVVVEDSNIANLFNDHFAEISSTLSDHIAETNVSFKRYFYEHPCSRCS